MKRSIAILTIVTATVSTFGCSMCCGPYDYDYPTFGGIHERVNPSYGRVGSIFSDPNAGFGDDSPDANLEPQPEGGRNSSETYDELDLEKLKRDLDAEELELINPQDPQEPGKLPGPDEETTASRMWKNKPLRAGQEWR